VTVGGAFRQMTGSGLMRMPMEDRSGQC